MGCPAICAVLRGLGIACSNIPARTPPKKQNSTASRSGPLSRDRDGTRMNSRVSWEPNGTSLIQAEVSFYASRATALPGKEDFMSIRLVAAVAAICLATTGALAQSSAKPNDPQIAHIAYTAGQ